MTTVSAKLGIPFRQLLSAAAFMHLALSSYAFGQSCSDFDLDGVTRGIDCPLPQDCNDDDATVGPFAAESCDGRDDDCDGLIDEGCDTSCPSIGTRFRSTVATGASTPRLVAADRGWIAAFENGAATYPTVLTRLDERGVPIAPLRTVSSSLSQGVSLVRTGGALGIGWSRLGTSTFQQGAYFRRFDRWGESLATEQILSNAQAGDVGAAWTGIHFRMIWSDTSGGSLPYGSSTASVTLGGELEAPPIEIDPVPVSGSSVAWSGVGFGWSYCSNSTVTGHQELYFQALTSSGDPTGPSVPITNHSDQSADRNAEGTVQLLRVSQPPGYAVSWSDKQSGTWQVWFARLDESGGLLSPPGRVRVSNTNKDITRQTSLAFTGTEFLIAWINQDQFAQGGGQVWVARVSMDGQILDRRQVTTGRYDNEPQLAWNGHVFGMLHESQDSWPLGVPSIRFVEIGCHCATDEDADGLPACGTTIFDCDDADRDIGALPESCGDGKDNNCDGLPDCVDPQCAQSGAVPEEVAALLFDAERQTIRWTPEPVAVSYDLARGLISDLVGMTSTRWAACAASKLSSTEWTDPAVPPAGDGFYYLVRGRAAGCRVGTWGSQARDQAIRSCP